MPGYVIHIAIAQEYLKKHNQNFSGEFIEGSIYPDLISDKSKSSLFDSKLSSANSVKSIK